MMRKRWGAMLVGLTVLAAAVPALADLVQRPLPYFGSISASQARMRTGPARSYPATWLYRRADLPVRVIASYHHGEWLKIEDPGGTQGWMLGNLVSNTRTAIIVGETTELRDAPHNGGRVQWRAQAGVVGRLSHCGRGWCHFDARGQGGYVEANRLWGVDSTETFD